MRFLILILSGIMFQTAYCASGSPIRTGITAEQNRIDMMRIKEGMEECEILKILGYPYKKERHQIDHQVYEIWFYITHPVGLTQTKLVDENFTPLIFQNGYLLGFGKLYYRHLLDIDHARDKVEEGKKQTYTNDKEEWPQEGTHVILTPPTKQTPQEQKPLPEQKIAQPPVPTNNLPPPTPNQQP